MLTIYVMLTDLVFIVKTDRENFSVIRSGS